MTAANGDEVATASARKPVRAEGVGSLLRRQELKGVFEKAYGGNLHVDVFSDDRKAAIAELHRLAESELPEVVQRQIDAGLDVVTDGELSRGFFANSMIDAISGIELDVDEMSDDWSGDPIPVVRQKLGKRGNPALGEAEALIKTTDFPKKVTFPAPSFFYFPKIMNVDSPDYSSRDEFIEDIVTIQRELVDEVIAASIDYVQFDFPIYPLLVDADATERVAALGETPESLLEKALTYDARMVEGLPSHVTKALHLCRGNQIRFMSGSISPIAEKFFSLPFDRFLVEWHDVATDGSYEPISLVPKDKIVAMGLISTKSSEVESEDDILGKLDEAGKFLDPSQLAIAPQCGFASTWQGHKYPEDIQWKKLEVAGRVADRMWGDS